MRSTVLGLLSFLLITSASAAQLKGPFQIKVHNHSKENEKYAMEVFVSCMKYEGSVIADLAAQKQVGDFVDCGKKSHLLKINNEDIVDVPKLTTLNSRKKKHHTIEARLHRINADGSTTLIKSSDSLNLPIEGQDLIEVSLYTAPGIELQKPESTHYSLRVYDVYKPKIFAHSSNTDLNNKKLSPRYVLTSGNLGEAPRMELVLSTRIKESSGPKIFKFVEYSDLYSTIEEFIKENDLE